MYRPPSKRIQLLQRIAIYSAMSTAVVVLVAALAFFMLGYQINRDDGKIEQGGLVQFDSQPGGAEVMIDGGNLGARTATRKTMTAGQHYIEMRRQGYQSWQKSVDVKPGSILWLTYPRLFPEDLTPTKLADFATVSSTAVSPNSKWMAIKEDASNAAITLVDLGRDDAQITTLTLPETSYTKPSEGKTQTFALEKWNGSSRHILMKHTYDDTKVEWIIADSQNMAQTKNITTLLGVEATKVQFSNNDASTLYALIDNAVRKIDVNAVTISGPLVSGVAEFSIYNESTILYVTLPAAETNIRSVGYRDESASASRTLRSYSDNGQVPLHVAVGRYFDDDFIAIAYDQSVDVMKGSLTKSDATDPSAFEAVATMSVPGGVRYLSILTEGRFVVAQAPSAFMVYDLELKKTTSTTMKNNAEITRQLRWLDRYTVWNDQDGVVRSYEFDGANQHEIMPVAEGFNVTYSPNAKYIYGIATSEDGSYHLQRVRMVLP